jgi:very-short-patch-repair endonuclease
VAAEQEHGYSRAESERRLRALLRPSGLPMPRFNQPLHGHLVDCHWAAQRLVLEVDGYQWHGSRAAFEADRRRDQNLVAAGYRVIRITWSQLTREPGRVLVKIAQALAIGPA